MSFSFRYGDARHFKELLKGLSVFYDESTLQVKREGVIVRQMTPDRTQMVDLKIPREAFDEYVVTEETKFAVNVDTLLSHVFKRIDRNDEVSLTIGKDEKLLFTVHGDLTRKWKEYKLEPEEEEQPIPKVRLTTRVILTAKALEKILADAYDVSNSVNVKSDHDKVVFKAVGELGRYEVALRKGNRALLTLECNEEAEAKYTPDRLMDGVKAFKKITDVITIEYATDMPCKMSAYATGNGVSFDVYTAPRIEED